MSDLDKARRDDADAGGLDRREFLGLLGIGALTLATGTVAGAAQTGSGTCPPITCPSTPPPLPATPDLTGFPNLAKFVAALARTDADATTNRITFNTCPNDFFRTLYKLTDAEVAAVLKFDPASLLAAIGERLPDPKTDPAKWEQQYKLAYQTIAFWNGWTDVDDCYIDPLGPCGADEQYGKPRVRIYSAAHQGNTLLVKGQGFVTPMELKIIPAGGGSPTTITGAALNVNAQSTFRCGEMSPQVTLQAGQSYSLELKVSGFPATFGPFTA